MLLLAIPILVLTGWAMYRAVTNEKAMPAIGSKSQIQLEPTEDGWEGQTQGFAVRAWRSGRKVDIRIRAPQPAAVLLKVRGGPWAGATLDAEWLRLPQGKHPLKMPMQRHHGHSNHLEVYRGEICLRVGSTGQLETALAHLGELMDSLDGLCRDFREEISAHFEPSPEALTGAVGGIPLGPGRWRGHNLRIFMDNTQTVLTLDHAGQLPADLRLGKRVQGPHRVGNPVVDLLLSAQTEQPEALSRLATLEMAEPLLELLNEYPFSELHSGLVRVVLPAPLQVPLLPALESAWTLVQALEQDQPKKG
ncbi:MAG: hypothetical protein ACI9VR_000213 [Cognaticolwellia sp.]|jgi:hypothetical protein